MLPDSSVLMLVNMMPCKVLGVSVFSLRTPHARCKRRLWLACGHVMFWLPLTGGCALLVPAAGQDNTPFQHGMLYTLLTV